MADSDEAPNKARPDATPPDDEPADAGPATTDEQPDPVAEEIVQERLPPPRTASSVEGGATPPDELAPPVPRAPRSGRVIASLALLLSLVAAGGTGYLLYRDWLDDPEARLTAAIDGYASELANLRQASAGETAAVEQELARIAKRFEEQEQALSEARTGLADAQTAIAEAVEATADSPQQAPPTPAVWRLAEVEYLLTIANHRLGMEHDADAARNLLLLADETLAALDDFRFHEVRGLIAEEALALRTVEFADTERVFLRLEALKGLLDTLPARLPEYTVRDERENISPEATEEASLLDALLGRLDGLVRFRRHDGEAIRPLLAPEEADYLEQHLRLALEVAQVAVLRRNQNAYETSLRAARDYLGRFLDASRAAVVEALGELDELLAVKLGTTPPDISRSLRRLRELRREPGEPAP